MRQAKYRYMGKSGEQMSFVRPLDQNPYPRFHIYLKDDKAAKKVSLTLHLDQKQTSYKGVARHSGDYKGKLLEKEAERLKQVFQTP